MIPHLPLALAAGCLVALGLLWAAWKIRQRYRVGRQAIAELKQQARSMQMDPQAMADSAAEVSSRKKK
jgi:type VI protein secretion system component VasK